MSEARSKPLRILLVDDHALLRNALAVDLIKEPDFEVVGTAGSIAEALQLLESQTVDLLLLDVDLGNEHGGDLLRLARQSGFGGKAIIVTVGVHHWEAVRLLRSGASAIFLKQGTDESLFQLIRDVAATEHSPTSAPRTETARITARRSLTDRQAQVMRELVDGRTNKEIANTLNIREGQVKDALQGLFLKTGVRTRAQLVRLAIEKYWSELPPRPAIKGQDTAGLTDSDSHARRFLCSLDGAQS